MTRPVRLSFVCESSAQASWSETVELWQAADDIEVFECGWTFDHFYPWIGAAEGPCFEGWVALTALLAQTRRIRGGLLVSCAAYRHPAVLANMIATLDIASGGRLEVGLGAGWLAAESAAYGIDLLTPGERADRFAEYVDIVVSLLTNETTTRHGAYFDLTEARCEPKPVQRPHPPLCIGGSGERKTIPLAARMATHWNLGTGSPRTLRRKRDLLVAECAALGRDPAELICSTQIRWSPGDPAAFADLLAEYVDAGLDLAVVQLGEPYSARDLEQIATILAPSLIDTRGSSGSAPELVGGSTKGKQ